MNLCKCDLCELVAELEQGNPSPYAPKPTVPSGWSTITIVRNRTIQPQPAQESTMRIDAGELGEMAITTEATPAPDNGITVAVVTELHCCPKCLEKFVSHPAVSRRVASDDTRVEASVSGISAMPSMSIKARRRPL